MIKATWIRPRFQ